MDPELDDLPVEDFEIHENVLSVNIEMYWENHVEFTAACAKLMNSDYETVILDLTHVNFVFSAYMGSIGRMVAETTKGDKKLIIRITGNLSWLFEIAGFNSLVDVEVVA